MEDYITNKNQIEQLGEMTEEEWSQTLQSLSNNSQFDKMWQLAQKAPPLWSRKLLLELGKVEWTLFREGERESFQKLLWLAGNCVEEVPKLGGLVDCEKKLTGHSYTVECLAISSDGGILAIASGDYYDNTIRLWSLPDGKHLRTLTKHSDELTCLAISPDRQILASGSKDRTVQLWRLPDGNHLRTLEHCDSVECLTISPDGKMIASGCWNTVRLWGLPDGKDLGTLRGHSNWVYSLAISCDGKIIASGSYDDTVRLWGLPDGQHLRTIEHSHAREIYRLGISLDGKMIAIGGRIGYKNRTTRLWQLPDEKLLGTLEVHPKSIDCFLISPDGKIIATSYNRLDYSVQLWQLPDGKLLGSLEHRDSVSCLAMSNDGKVLVSGNDRWDNTVRLWSLPDGNLLRTLQEEDEVRCLAISPDGKMIVSGSSITVRLWSSQLPRLSALPVEQLTEEDREWMQQALDNDNVTEKEYYWL